MSFIAAAIFTFRQKILEIMPRWAVDQQPQAGAPNGVGGPYHYGYGLELDGLIDWMYQGVRARFVDHSVVGHATGAPEDALPYIGQMQQIVRGFQEQAQAYRARLRTAIDAWRNAGSAYGVTLELVGYVSPTNIDITVVSASGVWDWIKASAFLPSPAPYPLFRIDNSAGLNWNWDGLPLSSSWARAWVILYVGGLFAPEGTWGDGQVWDDGGTWDSTATLAQVSTIRDIVRRWRPLHIQVTGIIMSFATSATQFNQFAPPGSPTLPDGHWANWMKDVAGAAVEARTLNGVPNNFAILDGVQ